mmetsp:Transcript_24756/g.80804  ORF Transcript_24756/g.80804 Transcript_24756/m.80804 type:complete len:262 (+) Transcript_24756:114-899(+)
MGPEPEVGPLRRPRIDLQARRRHRHRALIASAHKDAGQGDPWVAQRAHAVGSRPPHAQHGQQDGPLRDAGRRVQAVRLAGALGVRGQAAQAVGPDGLARPEDASAAAVARPLGRRRRQGQRRRPDVLQPVGARKGVGAEGGVCSVQGRTRPLRDARQRVRGAGDAGDRAVRDGGEHWLLQVVHSLVRHGQGGPLRRARHHLRQAGHARHRRVRDRGAIQHRLLQVVHDLVRKGAAAPVARHLGGCRRRGGGAHLLQPLGRR